MRTTRLLGEPGRDQSVKNLFPSAAESACVVIEKLEHGSPAEPGLAALFRQAAT